MALTQAEANRERRSFGRELIFETIQALNENVFEIIGLFGFQRSRVLFCL